MTVTVERAERLAKRIQLLRADDEQFRNATPDPAVRQAARQPDRRLPQVLETLVEGYADRPALGWRARSLTTDPATGRPELGYFLTDKPYPRGELREVGDGLPRVFQTTRCDRQCL